MKKSMCIALLFLAIASLPLIAQSRGLDVIAKSLGGEHAVTGKQYAIFIAIDGYKEWMPLKNPVKDAREIRDILTSRYYVDQVMELYNGEATKAGMLRLFDTLIKSVKPEDSVFIYYAGHGQLDETETGFWIPVDAGTDRFEQKNWIPNIQVRNNIGKMHARHIALVSDSCFSGDILNPTRGAAPTIEKEYFTKAWSRVSRQVLTSGASESVPDQSEFSQQLKLALRGNTQPYLDPLMIYGQVRLGMKGTTPLFGDLKDSGHQEGASYLFFLKDPEAAASVPAALVASASGTAELSVTTSMEGAEVFVDGVSYGKSPALVSRLPSGRALKVSARLGDYSGSTELSLAPKEIKEISLTLEKMRANILIVSNQKALSVFVDGEPKGPLGSGLLRDLPAGDIKLELKGDGLYYAGTVTLRGEETTKVGTEPWDVGSIEYSAPTGVSLSIAGTKGFRRAAEGMGRLDNLAIGEYTIEASDIGTGSYRKSLTVQKGKTASFAVATGRIAFDWLPLKAAITLDGKVVPVSRGSDSRAITPALYAREYEFSVSLPGIGNYAERFTVKPDADTRAEKLSVFVLDALKAQGEKRRLFDTGGWISLGFGALGAVGAGASYILGTQAMDTYRISAVTTDIAAARSRAELYGSIFVWSAIAGSLGFSLTPVLWTLGPNKKGLESSIREIDARIEAFKRAGQ